LLNSITRLLSLLALAGGFLLTALLVIPHALTFPGAFAPDGLLGAGLQTTPWLNEFWFLGLPSAVIRLRVPEELETRIARHNRLCRSHDGHGRIRVDLGQADREEGSVDLSEAALGALRTLKGKFELTDHGIAASAELASALPPVVGHRGQLQEVITNLLHNAMESMTTIQPDRRVPKVRTKLDGGNPIVVEVRDSGPGIDPKHLDRITEYLMRSSRRSRAGRDWRYAARLSNAMAVNSPRRRTAKTGRYSKSFCRQSPERERRNLHCIRLIDLGINRRAPPGPTGAVDAKPKPVSVVLKH
jgi:hypothetical protein